MAGRRWSATAANAAAASEQAPVPRQERRGSIAASIDSFTQPLPAADDPTASGAAPTSSFNLVWQRKQDGSGWSMGPNASHSSDGAGPAEPPPPDAPLHTPTGDGGDSSSGSHVHAVSGSSQQAMPETASFDGADVSTGSTC